MKVGFNDKIEVDEVFVESEVFVYFMLYKLRGVILVVNDDKGRKIVVDFFLYVEERIYLIGCLDYDMLGLFFLINDGEFVNQLMYFKFEVDKVYVVKIKGILSCEKIRQLQCGVMLEDGKIVLVCVKVFFIDKSKQMVIVELMIYEGKNC